MARTNRSLRYWLLGLSVALASPIALGADGKTQQSELFPFVLPWDDASVNLTNVSHLLEKPAGKHGHVIARADRHLYAGDKRIRLLGVNFCFGANFPEKPDAEKIAKRLARFGINAVRFHHMDMMSTPGGIFAADGKTLDPKQLDKLDYFFNQLKSQGIYGDLNLHVSRTYPGMPTWPGMPGFLKGVDNFDPTMIKLQKEYAKDLLTHVNPYTKLRYADDPGVVIVEINNENALTHEWMTGELDEMPPLYADALQTAWNAFLKKKYPTEAALKTAWKARDEPLGKEYLKNNRFTQGLDGWLLEQHEGAKAEAIVNKGQGVRLNVLAKGAQGWHVQFNQSGLRFEQDKPYTLTFRIRADVARKVSVNVSQAHAPWQGLWSTDLPLTTEWKDVSVVVRPSATDDNARLAFTNLADETGGVEISKLSLKPGGVLGLEKGETFGAYHWIKHRDYSGRTNEAQTDWMEFLAEAEDRYWSEIARYLKEDLKVKSLLVGTQLGWSPPAVQEKLDIIDTHAYWQHPNFPGNAWDPAHWTIQNIPMAGRADGGTLPNLALSRIAGKPFICTEYNHSAPNTYASETIPLITAFANFQDWDGVFLFAYSHRTNEWDVAKIPSFFDIDQHPTKMATLPAAAALFHRSDSGADGSTYHTGASADDLSEQARKSGPFVNAGSFGLHPAYALDGKTTYQFPGLSGHITGSRRESNSWTWSTAKGNGTVKVDSNRSLALLTTEVPGEFAFKTGVTIKLDANRQNWAVISLTATDGPSITWAGKVLLTATGEAWNTAMKWNDAKNSVGADWGKSPSVVEGIPASVTLPVASTRLTVWALDERGKARTKVPVADAGEGKSRIDIGPKFKTLWYEIQIAP